MVQNKLVLDSPLSPWHSPQPLQSTSPVLSHQHSDPQLLRKWPRGHMGSGKSFLVAQRILEVGAEVGPKSQEAADWKTD